MVEFLRKFRLVVRSRLKSRARLEAENLVLRQQVIVLSRKSRSRVQLRYIDRLVFLWLYRLFPSILNAITVQRWRGSNTIRSSLNARREEKRYLHADYPLRCTIRAFQKVVRAALQTQTV